MHARRTLLIEALAPSVLTKSACATRCIRIRSEAESVATRAKFRALSASAAGAAMQRPERRVGNDRWAPGENRPEADGLAFEHETVHA